MTPDKILVVEDEPTLLETLVYNLSHQGYTLETATDGQAAIAAARQFMPDLIVLDIMLPIIDGFEVCRILRQETNVPIVMLTARDDEIDRRKETTKKAGSRYRLIAAGDSTTAKRFRTSWL